MPKFTVAQILDAAEQNKYKNFNDTYIAYELVKANNLFGSYYFADDKTKPIMACVIGEAFLNLGLVENGTDASKLSYALGEVKADDPSGIPLADYRFFDLSDFINTLNGVKGYRGKKRVVRLARKYFSKSLDQVVEF